MMRAILIVFAAVCTSGSGHAVAAEEVIELSKEKVRKLRLSDAAPVGELRLLIRPSGKDWQAEPTAAGLVPKIGKRAKRLFFPLRQRRVTLRGIPNGRYQLWLSRDADVSPTRDFEIFSGKVTQLEVEFIDKPNNDKSMVSGQLRLLDNHRPVAQVPVLLEPISDPKRAVVVTSDARGRFYARHLPLGTTKITAPAPDRPDTGYVGVPGGQLVLRQDGRLNFGTVFLRPKNDLDGPRGYYGIHPMRTDAGITVRAVVRGSPADGKVAVDDIVVAVNGIPIDGNIDRFRLATFADVGDQTEFRFADGRVVTLIAAAGQKIEDRNRNTD